MDVEGIDAPVRVEPFLFRPQTCNTCLQYNHSTKRCRAQTPTCRHCRHTGHSIKTCQHSHDKTKSFCIHCQVFGHSPGQTNCAKHQQETYIARSIFLQGINRQTANTLYRQHIQEKNHDPTLKPWGFVVVYLNLSQIYLLILS